MPIVQSAIDDIQFRARQALEPISHFKKQMDNTLAPLREIQQHIAQLHDNERDIITSRPQNRGTIIIPDFQVKQIVEGVVTRLSKKSKIHSDRIKLILHKNGKLYFKDKPKLKLQLEIGSKHIELLKILTYKYSPTKVILTNSSIKNCGSIRRTISTLNSKAKYSLKIKIIEGKRKEGYRINPLYKIQRPR